MGAHRGSLGVSTIVVASIVLIAGAVVTLPVSAGSAASSGFPAGYNSTYFRSVNSTSANLSRLAATGFSPPAPPAWPARANWYTYQWNLTRSGYNPNESTIARSNVSSMTRFWAQPNLQGPITSSLISVNGSIYVGTWGGKFYSLNASTGSINWVDSLTNPVLVIGHGSLGHIHGGIYSTATFYKGMIYETAGTSNLTAIYPLNGSVAWCADVANSSTNRTPYASPYYKGEIWSSPVVYAGNVYVGVSSTSDNYAFQGQLVQVPISGPTAHPASHSCKVYHGVSHVFYSVSAPLTAKTSITMNATGGGIWSTGSVDPRANIIWIDTGNCNCTTSTKFYNNHMPSLNNDSENIVALNATTLAQVANHSYFQSGDEDFGAGPILFVALNGSAMVGAMNKNTTFDTMIRSTGASAWYGNSYSTTDTGSAIAPAAYDGTRLFVADDQANCRNGANGAPHGFNGTIQSINVSTGSDLTSSHGWHACTNPSPGLPFHQGAVDLAGLAEANGLLIDASTTLYRACKLCIPGNTFWNSSVLEVRNTSTGQVIYHSLYGQINTSIAGEPIVSDGQIYVGLGNFSLATGLTQWGVVEDFGLPLSVRATLSMTVPTTSQGTWVMGGYATVTGGMPGYTCKWYWGGSVSTTGCGTPGSPASNGYPIVPATVFTANLTVIDYRGAKVVIPFNVTVGTMTSGSGITSDSMLMNCGRATNNSWPAVGGCSGSLSSRLNVSGGAAVFGGIPSYSYSWDFGDHSALVTTQLANHAYALGGTYLVAMTGKDSLGFQAVVAVWVTVTS